MKGTLEMCECRRQCVGIFYDNYLHENYASIIKLKYWVHFHDPSMIDNNNNITIHTPMIKDIFLTRNINKHK